MKTEREILAKADSLVKEAERMKKEDIDKSLLLLSEVKGLLWTVKR